MNPEIKRGHYAREKGEVILRDKNQHGLGTRQVLPRVLAGADVLHDVTDLGGWSSRVRQVPREVDNRDMRIQRLAQLGAYAVGENRAVETCR